MNTYGYDNYKSGKEELRVVLIKYFKQSPIHLSKVFESSNHQKFFYE